MKRLIGMILTHKEHISTLLKNAAKNGDVETIRILYNRFDADITRAYENGLTPLHIAASKGHADAIRTFVELGASTGAVDKDGNTPLHVAAENGHVDAILMLHTLRAYVCAVTKRGYTPLHAAASSGHAAAIRTLVALGADICPRASWFGATPLHLAVSGSHSEAVRVLLAAGVDVNAKAGMINGTTPLQWVSPKLEDGRLEHKNYIEVIRLLLAAGANVHVGDSESWTPLHWAAYYGNVEAIQALIERGANVNDVGLINRITPLHLAASRGHVDAVRVLVGLDADVRLADHYRNTVLHSAVLGSRYGAPSDRVMAEHVPVELKVEEGGKASLHLADWSTLHHHIETVQFLLTLPGVDINSRNANGRTALDLAVSGEIAMLLDEAAASRPPVPPKGTDAAKPEVGFWGQYYSEGVNKLLPLRLADTNTVCMQAVMLNDVNPVSFYISLPDGQTRVVLPVIYEASGKPAHWIGVIIDYVDGSYQVTYIDPENNAMPDAVREAIFTALPANTDVTLVQMQVTAQSCSDNCGPELVENIAKAITGHRVPESLVAAYHSELIASSLAVRDTSDGKVKYIEVEAASSAQPVLRLDTLTTSFNAFMKLAHDCGSNLQLYGVGLIEQASELLNKLLDAARETTIDRTFLK